MSRYVNEAGEYVICSRAEYIAEMEKRAAAKAKAEAKAEAPAKKKGAK